MIPNIVKKTSMNEISKVVYQIYKKTSLSFAFFFVAIDLGFVTFLKVDIEKMIVFVGDIANSTKKNCFNFNIF
jgi:hypothetical protein